MRELRSREPTVSCEPNPSREPATPKRVRARRARGYKAVHRPTRWGNPFPIDAADPASRARSLRRYEAWLDERLRAEPDFLEPLRGHDLGCFCRLDEPCHADVILQRLYGRAADR